MAGMKYPHGIPRRSSQQEDVPSKMDFLTMERSPNRLLQNAGYNHETLPACSELWPKSNFLKRISFDKLTVIVE